MIENLEKLLAKGQDNAVLRFGLGKAYLDRGDSAAAVVHLQVCVRQNPDYSAAWKILGKALVAQAQTESAIAAYRQGIVVARRQGDLQAVREMEVFMKRLQGAQAKGDPSP